MATSILAPRHIQNMSEAKTLEPHWGYADRALPCTNDPGSCQYLDSVYRSHDLGMLYTGIIWATFGGMLLLWTIGKRVFPGSRQYAQIGSRSSPHQRPQPRGSVERFRRSLSSLISRWLLPEFARPLFGRTTRLQAVILALLLGYLSIFTFAGIEYKRWVTPVKTNPGLHNVRSGLGPFADRVGVLAYALIPLSVLLSSRESLLSLLTGIPYQHFNFIHRWLGYVIFAQSLLHTIGWTIIEVRLYQPQPKVAKEWITQRYMIWGVVAQVFLLLLFVLSLRPVIKITGYEFFRKAHYIIAILFIGGCWGHWQQLKCFLLPSLLIWFVDRGARLIRTWMVHCQFHSGKVAFIRAQANITMFADAINGDVVRLDFDFAHDTWSIGQHFYLCFPELSIWQSHPFTPLSLPSSTTFGLQQHSYIIRAKSGETRKLAKLAHRKFLNHNEERLEQDTTTSTPVILTGPYGEETTSNLIPNANILCIAGGSGVTYVLPVLLHLIQQPARPDRKVEFIWAVRKESDIEWIRKELDTLEAAIKTHQISIRIFVTRECCQVDEKRASREDLVKEHKLGSSSSSSTPPSSSSASSISASDDRTKPQLLISTTTTSSIISSSTASHRQQQRPDLETSVHSFIDQTIRGPSVVYASGPASMITDLRKAVAECNSPSKVWRGRDERFDVELFCDDRMEW